MSEIRHIASAQIQLSERTAQWASLYWPNAELRLNVHRDLEEVSEEGIRSEREAAYEMINALADAGLPPPGNDTVFWARAAALICDPQDRHEWSYLFGMAIQKRIDLFHFDALASLLISTLANGSTDDVARIFGAAIEAKRESEKSPHRNAWAFVAFMKLMREIEREPSKPELKDYIDARRHIYRDAPSADDNKGWTRLWKATKLWPLADKRPTKAKKEGRHEGQD